MIKVKIIFISLALCLATLGVYFGNHIQFRNEANVGKINLEQGSERRRLANSLHNANYDIKARKTSARNAWDPISQHEYKLKLKKAFDKVDPYVTDRGSLTKLLDQSNIYSIASDESQKIFNTPKEDELSIDVRRNRVVFVLTPTYERSTQLVDLTRLRQVLQLANIKYGVKIYWIVAEDADQCSERVRNIILESNLPYAHINSKTESIAGVTHRGVSQRNTALELIENLDVEGVVYLGDDDNAYDVKLFVEMTRTKRFGLVAGGFLGSAFYQRCKVDPNNPHEVIAFSSNLHGWDEEKSRKYLIDMAQFFFTTTLLKQRKARFRNDWTHGYLETSFMSLLVDNLVDIEPLGSSCNAILVWHVKTAIARIDKSGVSGDAMEETELLKSLL